MKKEKEKTVKKGGVAIKKHFCDSIYQDQKYGEGNRVCNIAGSKETVKYNCTVCGKSI